MLALANLAFVAMLVSGLATGLRLVLAAARNGRAPELWIGLSTLLAAVGGVIDTAALRLAHADPAGAAFTLQAAARLCYVFSSTGLGVGIWRIFRPQGYWGAVLTFAIAMVSAGAWGAYAAGGLHSFATGATASLVWLYLGRMAPYAWAAAESFAYHGRLRRQLRLGLAEPLIAHQFLLWGVASSAMLGLIGVILGVYWWLGITPLETPVGLVPMAVFGLVGASTIYTAFFPPAFYRRWILRRAAPAR